jgi:tetratricopeptide (TPR) repeat protein
MTPETEIAALRALRVMGRHDDHLIAARDLVARRPEEVGAQIEAAYAYDRAGEERIALGYYETAYRLGVPRDERRRFTVGYGSTLRNVGRADDAVAVLAQAVADDPDYPALTAFLALALVSAGHPRAAMAAMIGCALDVARPDAFDGYDRALAEYQRELLEKNLKP